MKTFEDFLRENCNIEYSKYSGDEIVTSGLSAVMIAHEEWRAYTKNRLDAFIARQKDNHNEFVDIVNEEFWNLI